MSEVIVDTNVIVVANRQNFKVVQNCVDACIKFLIEAKDNSVVLIDRGDEIRKEYSDNLKTGRPYQLGAQFLFHILQQMGNDAHVRIVDLGKHRDGSFSDFPKVPELANFDRSDRKFAALARKTRTAVTNAVDGDWADSRIALKNNGINVSFLCGCKKANWFLPGKRGRRE